MPSSSATRTASSLRILCVDDEPAIREVLRALLRREGHDVHIANHGADAWQMLRETPDNFDLLITDNEMPELTGLRLVQHVREAGSDIKIMVFSASLTPDDEDAFRAWNVDAIVAKGSPIDEVLGLVRRIGSQARDGAAASRPKR